MDSQEEYYKPISMHKPISIILGNYNFKFLIFLFVLDRIVLFIFLSLMYFIEQVFNFSPFFDPTPYLLWLIIIVGSIIFKPNINKMEELIGVKYLKTPNRFKAISYLPKENLCINKDFKKSSTNFIFLYENFDLYEEKRYNLRINSIFGNKFLNTYFHLLGSGLIILIVISYIVLFKDNALKLYNLSNDYSLLLTLISIPSTIYIIVSVGSFLTFLLQYYVFIWIFGNKISNKYEKSIEGKDTNQTINIFHHKEFPLIKESLYPFVQNVQVILIKSLIPLAIAFAMVSILIIFNTLGLESDEIYILAFTVFGDGLLIVLIFPILYLLPVLSNRRILNLVKMVHLSQLNNIYWKIQYKYTNLLKEDNHTNIAEERDNIIHLKGLITEIEKISTWPYNVGEFKSFATTLLIAFVSAGLSLIKILLDNR